MELTQQQKDAIIADIEATPELKAIKDGTNPYDAAVAIADWYNQLAAPDFFVWKSVLDEHTVYGQTSDDATTWSWTAYIGRSVAERDAWRQMFNSIHSINPSLPQVRAGITDIFSGTGAAAVAQRAHINSLMRRKAMRIEKLLATGQGTVANVATAPDGPISQGDIVPLIGG